MDRCPLGMIMYKLHAPSEKGGSVVSPPFILQRVRMEFSFISTWGLLSCSFCSNGQFLRPQYVERAI